MGEINYDGESEEENEQFETVIRSVFGGSDGINKSTESGDGGVGLEQGGSDSLGLRLIFGGRRRLVADILEAHFLSLELV